MNESFYPVFSYNDFATLPKYHIYLKLLMMVQKAKGSAVALKTFDDISSPLFYALQGFYVFFDTTYLLLLFPKKKSNLEATIEILSS